MSISPWGKIHAETEFVAGGKQKEFAMQRSHTYSGPASIHNLTFQEIRELGGVSCYCAPPRSGGRDRRDYSSSSSRRFIRYLDENEIPAEKVFNFDWESKLSSSNTGVCPSGSRGIGVDASVATLYRKDNLYANVINRTGNPWTNVRPQSKNEGAKEKLKTLSPITKVFVSYLQLWYDLPDYEDEDHPRPRHDLRIPEDGPAKELIDWFMSRVDVRDQVPYDIQWQTGEQQ